MKLAKKVFLGIFIALLLGAVVGLAIWVSRNYSKLTSQTDLYTYEEYVDYGEERYEAGLESGKEYKVLAEAYLTRIQEMETQIESLNVQVAKLKADSSTDKETIANLESLVASLQTSKSELEAEVQRLNNLLAAYEEIAAISHQVEFIVNDQLFYNTAVQNGHTFDETTLPEYTEEDRVKFMADLKGWTLNGETVDFDTCVITADTTFVAEIDLVYSVTFDCVSSEDVYYVTTGESVNSGITTTSMNLIDRKYYQTPPQKDGYCFTGWTLDGENVLTEVADIVVEQNLEFAPTFMRANELYSHKTNEEMGFGFATEFENTYSVQYAIESIDFSTISRDIMFSYQDGSDGAVAEYGFAYVGETVTTAWGSFNVSIDVENNYLVWNFTTTNTTQYASVSMFYMYEIMELATIGEYTLIDRGDAVIAVNDSTGEEKTLDGLAGYSSVENVYYNANTDSGEQLFLLFKNDETEKFRLINIDASLTETLVGISSLVDGEVVIMDYAMWEPYVKPGSWGTDSAKIEFYQVWNGTEQVCRYIYSTKSEVVFDLTRMDDAEAN